MTAHSPFSGRNDRGSQAREWALQAGENENERLERYCAAMNQRDPYRRMWFVAERDNGRHEVDCRSREIGEWA
jgi:hypothetical protein